MTGRPRSQRLAVVIAGWLAAAALATGVTLAAVSSIGTGIFGNSEGPVDQDEIAAVLATATSPAEPGGGTSPATPATPTPTPPASEETPAADPTVITSPGGTVVALCADGLAEVLSWSPAQGYRVDSADRGPDDSVEVEFESGDTEVEVEVRCVDGVPDATVTVDD